MLDIKRIREQPDDVKAALRIRSKDYDIMIDAILEIDKARRSEIAARVANDGLSVREAEKITRKPEKLQKKRKTQTQDNTAAEVELSLRDALGVEVNVKYNDGRGTLSIDFYSKEQLYEFANKLGK